MQSSAYAASEGFIGDCVVKTDLVWGLCHSTLLNVAWENSNIMGSNIVAHTL